MQKHGGTFEIFLADSKMQLAGAFLKSTKAHAKE